jgi:hypothetical protein
MNRVTHPSSALPLVMTCCVACQGSDAEPPAAPCDPAVASCAIEHDFPAYHASAGEERDGVCLSWTLANDRELWINAVGSANDGMIHHSNWFFVPEDDFDLPDGHWDCWENGFSEMTAALEGGVLYAQSTQTVAEEQRFGPGAALRVPPRSRVIGYAHVLNASAGARDTAVRLRLETIPRAAVTAVLSPFRFTYLDLQIPPRARADFGGGCDIAPLAQALLKRDFAFRLHWVLPHFHQLGDDFRVGLVGGARDGEEIFALDGGYGEPLGRRFDPPVDLAASGATGLSFACGYDNPRDATVGFGIGDQEMCVMLGFAESGLLFDGTVSETSELTRGADGVTRGSGPCRVVGVPDADAR